MLVTVWLCTFCGAINTQYSWANRQRPWHLKKHTAQSTAIQRVIKKPIGLGFYGSVEKYFSG
jgi:hypothetical protein